jgi:protein-arginine kinase activator protein McsA
MSDSDLEKLADLIVNKLVAKQQEIDDEYIAKMVAQQKDMHNEDFTEGLFAAVEFAKFIPLNGKPSTEDQIKELQAGLKDAIEKEDYTRAADIQKNITKLEDGEPLDT